MPPKDDSERDVAESSTHHDLAESLMTSSPNRSRRPNTRSTSIEPELPPKKLKVVASSAIDGPSDQDQMAMEGVSMNVKEEGKCGTVASDKPETSESGRNRIVCDSGEVSAHTRALQTVSTQSEELTEGVGGDSNITRPTSGSCNTLPVDITPPSSSSNSSRSSEEHTERRDAAIPDGAPSHRDQTERVLQTQPSTIRNYDVLQSVVVLNGRPVPSNAIDSRPQTTIAGSLPVQARNLFFAPGGGGAYNWDWHVAGCPGPCCQSYSAVRPTPDRPRYRRVPVPIACAPGPPRPIEAVSSQVPSVQQQERLQPVQVRASLRPQGAIATETSTTRGLTLASALGPEHNKAIPPQTFCMRLKAPPKAENIRVQDAPQHVIDAITGIHRPIGRTVEEAKLPLMPPDKKQTVLQLFDRVGHLQQLFLSRLPRDGPYTCPHVSATNPALAYLAIRLIQALWYSPFRIEGSENVLGAPALPVDQVHAFLPDLPALLSPFLPREDFLNLRGYVNQIKAIVSVHFGAYVRVSLGGIEHCEPKCDACTRLCKSYFVVPEFVELGATMRAMLVVRIRVGMEMVL